MSNVHSSAGVYVTEEDRSLRAENAPTTIGAIVGESLKGPVGVPTLITDTTKFINAFGYPNAQVSFLHHSALAFLEESSRLYVTRVAPHAMYGGLVVAVENNLSVAHSWEEPPVWNADPAPDSYYFDPTLYPFPDQELFAVYAANQGRWANGSQPGGISVIVYPNTNTNENTFYVDVYVTGNNKPVERHVVHLDYYKNGYGVQINVEEFINKRSNYIRVVQNRENPLFVANPKAQLINAMTALTPIVGGSDGTVATPGEIMTAWDLYRDPEYIDINILINGGYTNVAIQAYMTQLAENRMDCIAVLDVPAEEQSVSNAISFKRNDLQVDSSYAALYSPDYLILDKYSDRRLYVPPSGFVAAAYARTDTEFETWFAPAGTNRGRLDILGVRWEYNLGDRDALTDNQINPTRVIPGAGIRIWGADTLQSMASSLSNVSVRRLMLFLEKSLSIAVLYAVFDPNDSILRGQLVEVCERFLKPIKAGRGIYDSAVICDDTNNTPEVVANGDLMLDVYIDPTLPAKRIHLTAIVNKTGARFNLS